MIALDANYLIATIDPTDHRHAEIVSLLAAGETFCIPAIAWSEFQCGGRDGLTTAEDAHARTILSRIEPLSSAIAEHGARLFNATGRRQRSLADCLVAATTIETGLTLATANHDDFQPFIPHGLALHGA